MKWNTEYLAAGGNRHPSAADWDPASGLLAFGAERNLAIWSPLKNDYQGVRALLRGHSDIVNAVKFFPAPEAISQTIISGSVDKTIRIWQSNATSPTGFDLAATLEGHECSVNCLAVFKGTNIFASGSADATIRIWRLGGKGEGVSVKQVQTIQTRPRFFPLALALHSLGSGKDLILAVTGTKSIVQIYVTSNHGGFKHQVTLPGHDGWIRSLDITKETGLADSELLLASASQDKYIRLWRIAQCNQESAYQNETFRDLEKVLSNKAHMLKTSQNSYSVTFEALLSGHEDWIYTISWRLTEERLQLLSASADNSLAIWESEPSSGMWVCTIRLGEISAQKGSTTATGSTGGFYIGLWSPNGEKLISLGRTGSWRIWNNDRHQDRWVQATGISGHTKAVADMAWSNDGTYLLSTGLDQTTRLHAAWKRDIRRSWHEMARPQIHGYDLKCIDSIGQTQFISGADEKVLRVFDEPRATAHLLDTLCEIHSNVEEISPDAAQIPVLGLSNKAVEVDAGEETNTGGRADAQTLTSRSLGQTFNIISPPLEDQLARHTLWPEKEKLYGHGFEISAVASSHDGTVIATSCRASSLDHAVIRVYMTKDWREVRPSLRAHSLTVTALCFSSDDRYLMSVGRDRQWVVFERDHARPEYYSLKHSNPKGHSRMILDGCWAPLEAGRAFATAGRDKSVRIWSMSATITECTAVIVADSSVTSVDISDRLWQNNVVVALGTEMGSITLHILHFADWTVKHTFELHQSLQPSRSVTCLAWRPITLKNSAGETDHYERQLAIASDDSSLRLFSVSGFR